MKGNFYHTIMKRAALLCLALGTLFGTTLTLTSCGSGGDSRDEESGKVSLRQLKSGARVIYLQAGTGLVLKLDTSLEEGSSYLWGYAYPAQLGMSVVPGNQFKAVFQGLSNIKDPDEPLTGTIKIGVGFSGWQYTKEDGFTSFLGIPSSLNPQLQLTGPLEITLNMDEGTWKSKIPDASIVTWGAAAATYVYGENGGNASSSTTMFDQERQGFFDIIKI